MGKIWSQLAEDSSSLSLLYFQEWAMETYILFVWLRPQNQLQGSHLSKCFLETQEKIGRRLRSWSIIVTLRSNLHWILSKVHPWISTGRYCNRINSVDAPRKIDQWRAGMHKGTWMAKRIWAYADLKSNETTQRILVKFKCMIWILRYIWHNEDVIS